MTTFRDALWLATAAVAALPVFTGCEPQTRQADTNRAGASESDQPKGDPFADVTVEDAARKKSNKRNPFEGSLAERSVWKRALATVEVAEQHFIAAQEAHRNGDRAKLNEEGKLARTLFDQALENTALFEEELLVDYGEDDLTVAGILSVRNTWFDRTRWLHKTIAR